MTYPYDRNTSVMHASYGMDAIRPRSNDERTSRWAALWYARGLHRNNGKPRIRVTVPQPCKSAASAPGQAGALPSRAPGAEQTTRHYPYPVDSRELVDMSPELQERWETEITGEPS